MSTAQNYDVFQAIADPTRREVLHLLLDNNLSIAEITSHFDMSRTAIAKHLHVLEKANLVNGTRSGREKIYRLHPEPLTELRDWLSYYERFWNNKLMKLKFVAEND